MKNERELNQLFVCLVQCLEEKLEEVFGSCFRTLAIILVSDLLNISLHLSIGLILEIMFPQKEKSETVLGGFTSKDKFTKIMYKLIIKQFLPHCTHLTLFIDTSV